MANFANCISSAKFAKKKTMAETHSAYATDISSRLTFSNIMEPFIEYLWFLFLALNL